MSAAEGLDKLGSPAKSSITAIAPLVGQKSELPGFPVGTPSPCLWLQDTHTDFILNVLFQNSILQPSEVSCVHMWLLLFDPINDIDFPLNAKIAQFSSNYG